MGTPNYTQLVAESVTAAKQHLEDIAKNDAPGGSNRSEELKNLAQALLKDEEGLKKIVEAKQFLLIQKSYEKKTSGEMDQIFLDAQALANAAKTHGNEETKKAAEALLKQDSVPAKAELDRKSVPSSKDTGTPLWAGFIPPALAAIGSMFVDNPFVKALIIAGGVTITFLTDIPKQAAALITGHTPAYAKKGEYTGVEPGIKFPVGAEVGQIMNAQQVVQSLANFVSGPRKNDEQQKIKEKIGDERVILLQRTDNKVAVVKGKKINDAEFQVSAVATFDGKALGEFKEVKDVKLNLNGLDKLPNQEKALKSLEEKANNGAPLANNDRLKKALDNLENVQVNRNPATLPRNKPAEAATGVA